MTRRLSVGIYTYSTRPRGSVVHAGYLAEALVRAGHDVTLYALAKDGDAFYRPLGCRVVTFAAREAPADPELLVRQRVDECAAGITARARRHDVHHAEDCLAASALLLARERSSLGVVVRTVHHVERFSNPYLAACQRRSIAGADALFSVSRVTEREVLAEFGRASWLVHNGVDLERLRRAPVLGARFGVRDDDEVVLSVGGVEHRKNSLICLEAVARALSVRPRLRWLIAGGASLWDHAAYRAEFEARWRTLPDACRERVSRLGPVDEASLLALYRRCDVLLGPSVQEGWGLSVLEALAAGKPVVVSNREPFTEYLDAASARLVDPDSPIDVADALVELCGAPALRRSLGRAGLRVAERFSWDRAARLHARAYRELCGSRDAPRSSAGA